MSKNILFKIILTCMASVSCCYLGYATRDLSGILVWIIGIVIAVALIFIWTKDMEISTETRTIKVTWEKHQDAMEPDLPDHIQIPADLPDEDVYLYLTKHYGYTAISWDNLK